MDDDLFSSASIDIEIDNRKRRLHYEIEHIEAGDLMGTSVEDWCEYFTGRFAFEVPVLLDSEISVDQQEVDLNLSHEPGRDARHGPVIVRATEVTFFVPFQGDHDLFRFRPNQWSTRPPRANVGSTELKLSYVRRDHDALAARREFDGALGEIKQWLSWLGQSVDPFNNDLPQTARQRIIARREKVLKDHEMVAALGFPLRKADQARRTYVVDGPRRRIEPRRPSASGTAFTPEPELEMVHYEQILGTIGDMVSVMERSPKAFQTMGEEDLRDQLLVGLNASYEGAATGETFNFEGKTDILIRNQGRNIFVAECKIWSGPKRLTDAIDQLLGYASWRDTKTAIIIFNRTRDFSAVLGKIPGTVESHPNFKRRVEFKHESGYRCVLRHRDDVNRELVLTVLAFEVPRA